MKSFLSVALLLTLLPTSAGMTIESSDVAADCGAQNPIHKVYSRLMDPREHPDYDRRAVQPPSWDTIGGVLQKMSAWGARDAILCLHRVPENNITPEATRASFEDTLRAISATAATFNINLYLRTSAKEGMSAGDLHNLLSRVAATNLKLALDTALLLDRHILPDTLSPAVKDSLGAWLVGAPGYDIAGRLWTTNETIAATEHLEPLHALLQVAPDKPMLLNAVYVNQDEEYLDAAALKRVQAQ